MKVFIISVISLGIIYGLEAMFPYFGNRKKRFKHTVSNLSLGILNAVLIGILSGIILTAIMKFGEEGSLGFLNFFKLPTVIAFGIAFVSFDLWMYLWHRINHRVKFFWRFHIVHHTDTAMDVTTATRFHPVEILLSTAFRIPVVLILGLHPAMLIIYEISLQPIIFFHHSNIALPEKYDKKLRAIIVTPNMHRVHHSIEWFETNSNYSSVFSFWDRLLRSFQKREDTKTITFGLRILRDDEWQHTFGMLKTPFRKKKQIKKSIYVQK